MLIIFYLALLSCASCQVESKKWLDSETGIIVGSDKSTPFSGSIKITSDGQTCFANVENGIPVGDVYWLKSSGDTIQLLKFDSGEKVYSIQFDSEGKRKGNPWTKSNVYIDNSDLERTDKLIEEIKSYDTLALIPFFEKIALSNLEKKVLAQKLQTWISSFGEIKSVKVRSESKSKYGHRQEYYLEFKCDFQFETIKKSIGMRYLTNQSQIISLSLWLIENEEKNELKPLELFSLLNF